MRKRQWAFCPCWKAFEIDGSCITRFKGGADILGNTTQTGDEVRSNGLLDPMFEFEIQVSNTKILEAVIFL